MEKGQKLSEEHKRKIGDARKGKKRPPFSEEWKKNISEGHKGQVPWNKGKKHSLETRKKMSESHKGNPPTHWLGRKHSEESKRKMSEAGKGRKQTAKTRKKMSEAQKGEKCYNWKGGITGKLQRIRKSIESRLWREAVFARDNWTCQKCGDNKGGNLNPHHIQNFAQWPELRFAIDNGITFCRKCHQEFHKIFGQKNNTLEQVEEFLSNKSCNIKKKK